MRKIYLFLPPAIFFFISFIACKKITDHKEDLPQKAPFIMYEEVADTLYATDTALTLNYVRFVPGNEYVSVSWLIDNEPAHSNAVRFATEGDYPVTMIASRKNDAGQLVKETIVQTVHIVDREGGAAYLGSFSGAVAGAESDTFTISITRAELNYPAYPYNTHILSNLPKGCLSQFPSDGVTPLTTLYFGFNMFVSDAARCFPGGRCTGTYKAGKLTVDFSVPDPSRPFDPLTGQYPLLGKKYIGYRF